MFNSFFVVWRESLEALLIVGILYAWLKVNDEEGSGRRALAAGIAGGIGLAFVLGWALLAAQSELAGEALEAFQSGALIVAALLITQMVWWMSRHGRRMKAEIENRIARAHRHKNRLAAQWSIAIIAALAIAREGAETVIFLYGIAQGGDGVGTLVAGAFGGLAAAVLCALAAARGLAHLRLGLLLRISSILLLVLASSLLVAASERLIGMDWLPALIDPVWDSSMLLDNNTGLGRLAADFAGYRARPALTSLLIWGAYWLIALTPLYWMKRHART
ncbi:MAG: FTR1 family protein [Azoarcus sp.]|jgi:high-affinity iron transporter|nr:FTR1 family protein [Azoarcus sp.]